MKKKYNILLIFCVLLFLGYAVLVFRPWMQGAEIAVKQRGTVDTFLQNAERRRAERLASESEPETAAKQEKPAWLSDPLWQQMRFYNDQLYWNGQELSGDYWYQAEAMDFSASAADGVIGVVTIPSIGVELPLYSGASAAHLSQGLAVMNQTSLPIGGENTHCVIAGHRGWDNGDFLLDIEDIQIGDTVRCTNLWQQLTYTVEEIRIIEPDEIDAAKIQPGRDLLTLLTCHPYGSGGRYRYLVTCVRDEPEVVESTDISTVSTTMEEPPAPTEPVIGAEAATEPVSAASSKQAIAWKQRIPGLGAALILALAGFLIVQVVKRRRHLH